MNLKLVTKWLQLPAGADDPPGCETAFSESPIDPRRLCCTVGIVHEHRFAFHYWANYFLQCQQRERYAPCSSPHLVSLDFHDDVGGECDFSAEDLQGLNLADPVELSMFCWRGLRALNDGHIAPAMHLGFFADVFVLFKQDREGRQARCGDRDYTLHDRHGVEHRIRYHYTGRRLLDALRTATNVPIYLDIDLDFFTRRQGDDDETVMVPKSTMRKTLSLAGPLMAEIAPRVVGLTIALEPDCCGGLANSLSILRVVNQELFDNTLCTRVCRWRMPTSQST